MKLYCVYTNNHSPDQSTKDIYLITTFYSEKDANEYKKCLEDDYKNCQDKKIYMYASINLSVNEYPKEDLKFWIECK